MNTCLIHSQSYPLGCFCPYCGPPQTITLTYIPEEIVESVPLSLRDRVALVSVLA